MGEVFYVIYSFIGFICSVIPSVWHWKYRNIAPLCLIFWIASSNLIYFINSIIWFNGASTKHLGYIYCDIATKLMLGSTSGELGAIAAISHYLSKVMSPVQSSVQTKTIRRRQAIEDLLMSFTCPIIIMCLHYIVQSARYMINGVNGCVPWSDQSWPTVIIILIWPPIFGTISAYYSARVIYLYFKKQKEFQNILRDSKSSMTLSRFIRLIGICSLLITVYLPLNIYMLCTNIFLITRTKIKYSWSDVHKWGDGIAFLKNDKISFNLWLMPSNGIVIFIFFGMGSDAIAMYKEIARKLHISWLFDFKKCFTRRTRNLSSKDYYNSYDFEKSINRCPPLFYNHVYDTHVVDSSSLDYPPIPPVYSGYNKPCVFTDVPIYSSRNFYSVPFQNYQYEFRHDS
ncbi:hypothetical protein PMAC_000440 [Pneumocystis sp. 'macacae']|nr:hypothetical protein PMAC_000440 [Pneumocystis sp. 'macacae']